MLYVFSVSNVYTVRTHSLCRLSRVKTYLLLLALEAGSFHILNVCIYDRNAFKVMSVFQY